MVTAVLSWQTMTYTHTIAPIFAYTCHYLGFAQILNFSCVISPWIWRPGAPTIIFSKNIMRTFVLRCATIAYTHTFFALLFASTCLFVGITQIHLVIICYSIDLAPEAPKKYSKTLWQPPYWFWEPSYFFTQFFVPISESTGSFLQIAQNPQFLCIFSHGSDTGEPKKL